MANYAAVWGMMNSSLDIQFIPVINSFQSYTKHNTSFVHRLRVNLSLKTHTGTLENKRWMFKGLLSVRALLFKIMSSERLLFGTVSFLQSCLVYVVISAYLVLFEAARGYQR